MGITSSLTGTYHVVVRVSFRVDPTYLHANIDFPSRNVPRFVRDLINKKGIACIAGEDVLRARAEWVKSEEFPIFRNDVVKVIRKVPLVVIRSDDQGRCSVNPNALARKLAGAAIVEVLDCTKAGLNRVIEDLYFNPVNKEYSLRPVEDSVTVFFPGVSTDGVGAKRIYRYTATHLQTFGNRVCDELANNIIASAVRAFSYPSSLVSSCEDIRAISANARREELSTRRREIGMNVHAEEEHVRLRDEKESFKKELGVLKEKNQQYSADITRLQEMHENSLDVIDQKNQQIEDLSEYATLLENEVEEANKKNQSLREDNEEIWAIATENEQYKWKAQSLQSQLDESQKHNGWTEPGIVFRDTETLPETVYDSLLLASKVFDSRIIVLEEAFNSAKSHDSGSAAETWKIMHAIAKVLFPISIEGKSFEGGNLENYFKRETGFELSLHEKKATSENPTFRKQRERTYKGKTYNITPHVKGKSGKKSEPLRVQYCACLEEGKMLIGYCGGHLDTAGTRRKSL